MCFCIYRSINCDRTRFYFYQLNLYASEWGNIQVLRCDFSNVISLNSMPNRSNLVDCTFSQTQGGYLFDQTPIPQLKFASPIEPNLVYGKEDLLLYWCGEEFWYTMVYNVAKNQESNRIHFPFQKNAYYIIDPFQRRQGGIGFVLKNERATIIWCGFTKMYTVNFELIQEHKIPIQLQPNSIQQSMKVYPVKGGFLLYCIQIKLLTIHWKKIVWWRVKNKNIAKFTIWDFQPQTKIWEEESQYCFKRRWAYSHQFVAI